jgi:hypothetical protein
MVPGGQHTYVTPKGEFEVTPQHSNAYPKGSYLYGEGWHYHDLDDDAETGLENCPHDDKRYNCQKPTGYLTFRAPDAKEDQKSGVVLCPRGDEWMVWAVTPKFTKEGCVEVTGLSTHAYQGPNPPVWSYY